MANLTMEKQLEVYTKPGKLTTGEITLTRLEMEELVNMSCVETIDHFEVRYPYMPIVLCLKKQVRCVDGWPCNPLEPYSDRRMQEDTGLPFAASAEILWVRNRELVEGEGHYTVVLDVCDPKDAQYCFFRENYAKVVVTHSYNFDRFLENERRALNVPSLMGHWDFTEQDGTHQAIRNSVDPSQLVWILDNVTNDICAYVAPVGFCLLSPDRSREYQEGECRQFFELHGRAYKAKCQLECDLRRYQKAAGHWRGLYVEELRDLVRTLDKYKPYYQRVCASWYDERDFLKFRGMDELPGCFLDLEGQTMPYYASVVQDMTGQLNAVWKKVGELVKNDEALKERSRAEMNAQKLKADAARKAYYEEIQDFAKILLTAKVPVQAYDKDRKKVFERHPWTDPARPIERLQVTFERYQVVLMDLKEECMVSTCAYRPEYMASFAKVLKKFKTFVPLKVTRRMGVFQEL